jgi:hypothetical protein
MTRAAKHQSKRASSRATSRDNHRATIPTPRYVAPKPGGSLSGQALANSKGEVVEDESSV